MSFSHLLVVLIIVLLLFGAGKLPQVMSDLAKGVKAFRDSLNGHDDKNDKEKNGKD